MTAIGRTSRGVQSVASRGICRNAAGCIARSKRSGLNRRTQTSKARSLGRIDHRVRGWTLPDSRGCVSRSAPQQSTGRRSA